MVREFFVLILKGEIMEIKQLKAKPIFDEEKRFIEFHLNISLPNDCWIVGGGQLNIFI
jgi:hypothetical protein